MKNKKSTWTIFSITLGRGLWMAIFFIPLLWIATLLLLFADNKNNVGEIGVFGDMFGAVNALFSGFAFIGIIISIRMQSEELELQRKEIKETKEEFKNQNFQTTFFNLLRTQRELISEFDLNISFLNGKFDESSREVEGRVFFRLCKSELRKIFEALHLESYQKYNREQVNAAVESMQPINNEEEADEESKYNIKVSKIFTLHYYGITEVDFNNFKSKNEVDKVKYVYDRFFNKHGYAVGHYFRHFYHMLLFLEKSEEQQLEIFANDDSEENNNRKTKITEEYMGYAEFIKSQTDTPELVTLFYNSFNYDKAKRLLIKYQMLDTLHINNLINKERWKGYNDFNLWCDRHYILNKSTYGKYDYNKHVRKVNEYSLELATEAEIAAGKFMTLTNNPIENVWRHLGLAYKTYFGFSKEYAQLYFNEFMFRWNHEHLTNGERFELLLKRCLNTPLYDGKGKNRNKITLQSKFIRCPKTDGSGQFEWKTVM